MVTGPVSQLFKGFFSTTFYGPHLAGNWGEDFLLSGVTHSFCESSTYQLVGRRGTSFDFRRTAQDVARGTKACPTLYKLGMLLSCGQIFELLAKYCALVNKIELRACMNDQLL